MNSSDLSSCNAPSTFSGVVRLITPSVRCNVPSGLIACSGMPSCKDATFGPMAFSLKWERECWSCGRERGVTRGMARKCVKRGGEGFGGILRYVSLLRLNTRGNGCEGSVVVLEKDR